MSNILSNILSNKWIKIFQSDLSSLELEEIKRAQEESLNENVIFYPFLLKRNSYGAKKEAEGYLYLSKLNKFIEIKASLKKINFVGEDIKESIKGNDCMFVFDIFVKGGNAKFFKKEIEFEEGINVLKNFLGKIFEDEDNDELVRVLKNVSKKEIKVSLVRKEREQENIIKSKRFDLRKEGEIGNFLNFLKKHDWCKWKFFLEACCVYLIEPARCYECGRIAAVEIKQKGMNFSLCNFCYFAYKSQRNGYKIY